MRKLIKPKSLKRGDSISLISISGGRAGDKDMVSRYNTGKARLEELFGLNVVTAPNSLKGSEYLYEHPEARAEDLIWALKNPEIRGIIANMGGDDSYRVLPFIELNIIKENPKVFMGYSDITTWNTVFAVAGVMSYYGPNVLTPIAQPGRLDEYTFQSIEKTLFNTDIIGNVKAASKFTSIEWGDKCENEIEWNENKGYKVIQGNGIVQGRLFGGCIGPLRQIMGISIFPNENFFNDCILFLEVGSPYNNLIAGLHDLRALDAAGMFKRAKGLMTGFLSTEEEDMIFRFMKYEARRDDLPIITNADFVHRTPMTVIPIGAMAEIDCENNTFTILESGVC